jgi:segregation and condensation protein A
MSIHVQLERFEGPLGLLLHLIREQEMDIFNINIHQITRQYLEYIKTMRRLDLEVAGEFVAMAATLLHIKSRMLLPQYNEEGEVITEDPRKELVQKLVEYKKMQEFAQELYKRPLLGRDVYPRAEVELEIDGVEEGELVLEENPLFSLISSFRAAMKNMKKTVHTVASSMKSIAERILEIKDMLIVGQRTVMSRLITETENRGNEVLLTFLSLLELAKMGFISVFQTEPFADIFVDPKKVIDRDVVSQVENYDSVNAQAKADEIINEAQLSLEEPAVQFEGEEAPVVEASFADAATDEEIAAEEALLDGAAVVEGPGHVAEEIRAEETFLASTNGPNIIGFEEENRDYDASLVPHNESGVEAEVSAADVSTVEMVNEAHAQENVPVEEQVIAENEASASTAPPAHFFPQMIQEMPEDFTPPATDVVDKNVTAALSEALAAFDSFNEIEDKKDEPRIPEEKPPEVES